ncbi:MAG: hypothetical protein HYU51_16645 [Candidatus Rokubacteria bacterium]|nr:hypothetical protein [Candidatus Rokubacteria bacterium]
MGLFGPVAVDEIGKMECLSRAFVEAVRALLDTAMPVVATVAARGGGFIEEVKRRRDGARAYFLIPIWVAIGRYFFSSSCWNCQKASGPLWTMTL